MIERRGHLSCWGFLAVCVMVPSSLMVATSAGEAQDVRGWVDSSLRYVQARPLVADTFDISQAVLLPDGSFQVGGMPVNCLSGLFCSALAPGGIEHAVVGTQDLGFTAWGFGVEGLSAHVLLRGREQFSGEFAWPRSDDRFDALLGYLELYRQRMRLRVGRQNSTSGLGFASYDGVELTLSPNPSIRVSGYGGRSLARGLAEPQNQALRGLQDFVPDDEAYLLGASARLQTHYGTSIDIRYQREAWTDGHFLLSERASTDVRTSIFRPLRLTASADWDFAFGRVGKAQVSLLYPSGGTWSIEARGRRYVPYFDLSTIWGFFSPVAYHEAGLEATWAPSAALSIWGGGALRSYGETGATLVVSPLESDALRANAGVRWQLADAWDASGSYRLEWGAGAYLNSGDLSLAWTSGPLRLTGHGSMFQQIEEFRLGDLFVVGGGMSFQLQLGGRMTLDGGALRYRNRDGERAGANFDWSPTRAWTSLRVEIGGDPGMRESRP